MLRSLMMVIAPEHVGTILILMQILILLKNNSLVHLLVIKNFVTCNVHEHVRFFHFLSSCVCWVKWAVKSIPPFPLPATTMFNLLKYTRNFTYHMVQHSKILRRDHIAFMCFVWIPEQKENLPRLIFITEVKSVYCAIRAEYRVIEKDGRDLKPL